MAPSLDVPLLQGEEVDGSALLAFFTAQLPVIDQEIPEVSLPSSSCERASQPTDIEQVLDVPVLREIDYDFKLSSVLAWLALALAQEPPEVQVLPQARVDSLHDAQKQEIVREFPELQVFHAQDTIAEQMVGVPVPGRSSLDLTGRIVEQVVNVPVFRGQVQEQVIAPAIPEVQALAPVQEQVNVLEIPGVQAFPGFERVQQRTVEHSGTLAHTRSGTSSSSGAGLNPGESAGDGVFRTFPRPKKSAKVTRQSSANLLSHSMRVDAGTLWRPGSSSDWTRMLTDDGRVYWWNRQTQTSQWHPFVQEEEVAEEEEEYQAEYGYDDEDVYDYEPLVDRFAHAAVRPWRLCVFHLAGRCDAGWRCTFAHGEHELRQQHR